MSPLASLATFHILGVPHCWMSNSSTVCAFSSVTVRLGKMLKAAGCRVEVYGTGAQSPDVAQFADAYHEVVGDRLAEEVYGPDFRTRTDFSYSTDDRVWRKFVPEGRDRLMASLRPDSANIVLPSYGRDQELMCPPSSMAMTVEPNVGYVGCFAERRVFPSYAWQHQIYAAQYPAHCAETPGDQNLDAVIQHSVDSQQFELREKKTGNPLFLGRVTRSKGVHVAALACRQAGMQLDVAGPDDWGRHPEAFLEEFPEVNYLGPLGLEERRERLAAASALLCPTQYVEPFGLVAVEAQMSGTPVIASDWGAFAETVQHGITGFRVRDAGQAATALLRIGEISPRDCAQWARAVYSPEAVWPKYEAYFLNQLDLWQNQKQSP